MVDGVFLVFPSHFVVFFHHCFHRGGTWERRVFPSELSTFSVRVCSRHFSSSDSSVKNSFSYASGMELTFNYNLDCLGNGRTECHCGADNCSGFLGVRPKSACASTAEEKAKNAKLKQKRRKIKTEPKQMHEDYCFQCGDGGELVMCDKKDCPKAYHLLCLNLTQPPYGKWECPWHQCSVCSGAAVSFCEFCPHSFCKDHDKGALVTSVLEGRLCCSKHDPSSPASSEYWSKIKCKWEAQQHGEEAKE